ncbi:MAG: ScbA/BarX family gamma-butyrolactone biosynthesis protein [Jatrophihabitans sp.]
MSTSSTETKVSRALSWSKTIDRTLVHRDAIAEVLLTDVARVSDTEFAVAAQWPRSHRVYRPDSQGRHDPMLILETVRQTGLAVSHLGFDIGFDQHSVMRDVGFELDPDAEPRALVTATDVTVRVTCQNVVRRAGALRSMTVVLRFIADDIEFAVGTGTISWLSASTYAALRARAATRGSTGVNSWNSGRFKVQASARRAAPDALLAPTRTPGRSRQLVVPLNHPVYFDHPLDHAPGMLLIDAAWQAAAALHGEAARLVGCMMGCPAFTELGVATKIQLKPTSGDTTLFSVEQGGRATASGRFRIAV